MPKSLADVRCAVVALTLSELTCVCMRVHYSVVSDLLLPQRV